MRVRLGVGLSALTKWDGRFWTGLDAAVKPRFPLTDFICDLIDASPERLRKMDIEKTAKHYGLPAQRVRQYRNLQLGRPANEGFGG